jgi:predicted transcriptional regulator
MTGEGVDQDKRQTLRQFAALGATASLAGIAGTDASGDSDARGAIAGYLSTTPGAHFSKIRDDLSLATGETQYHLRQLEDDGAVESRRDGDYRRYFPVGEFSEFERTALGTLRRETPRGIVLALLADPDVTAGDIADRLDVSRPTVSKHAATLEEQGLLSREDGYELVDPETTLLLVVRYADSLGPDARSLATDAAGLLSYDP